MQRKDLLVEKETTNENDMIVFSTTHNPNNAPIAGMIKNTYKGIQSTDSLKNVFKNKRMVIANKRTQNLKEIVTHASYENGETKLNRSGIKRCGKNCVTCGHLQETTEVKFNEHDKPFHLKYNFSCNSRNLIYLIVCKCKVHTYIGECQILKQRVLLHRSNINCERNRILKVSKHIYECSKGEFSIYPFYKMQSDNELERKLKEKYFIDKYRPSLNSEN